jgi:ferredoxin--NADP+ reductase
MTFAFNEVGKTTRQLGLLKEGSSIWNITGPLGIPSEIKNKQNFFQKIPFLV